MKQGSNLLQARDSSLLAQSSEGSARSKKSTLTQQMDTFVNPNSLDEESATSPGVLVGGLDEICGGAYGGAYQDCAANLNDTRTVSTRGRRVTGSFWGQKPDDLASRCMNLPRCS